MVCLVFFYHCVDSQTLLTVQSTYFSGDDTCLCTPRYPIVLLTSFKAINMFVFVRGDATKGRVSCDILVCVLACVNGHCGFNLAFIM